MSRLLQVAGGAHHVERAIRRQDPDRPLSDEPDIRQNQRINSSTLI
jgi:hypothetical protein